MTSPYRWLRILALLFAGLLLSVAYAELELSLAAREGPVPVDLEEIERGTRPSSRFVRIGPHVRSYLEGWYSIPRGEEMAAGEGILAHTTYPIYSKGNPNLRRIRELELESGRARLPSPRMEPPPEASRAHVIVKTRAFKRKKNVPWGLVESPGVTGLLLGERNPTTAHYRGLHGRTPLVLEEGLEPWPVWQSVLLCLFSLSLLWTTLRGLIPLPEESRRADPAEPARPERKKKRKKGKGRRSRRKRRR